MLLFNLDRNPAFGCAVAADLDQHIAPHEVRTFEDGEFKLRPLADPRGEDCQVLHGLHGDTHHSPQDKLFAPMMRAGALKDHGARQVAAVLPYLAATAMRRGKAEALSRPTGRR